MYSALRLTHSLALGAALTGVLRALRAAVGFEVPIALDGQTEFAAHGLQFHYADIAKFRTSHS